MERQVEHVAPGAQRRGEHGGHRGGVRDRDHEIASGALGDARSPHAGERPVR